MENKENRKEKEREYIPFPLELKCLFYAMYISLLFFVIYLSINFYMMYL